MTQVFATLICENFSSFPQLYAVLPHDEQAVFELLAHGTEFGIAMLWESL